MPMHGYTKIELTDVKTGKVETVEKHNIVTNAVVRVFNSFSRAIDIRATVSNNGYRSLGGDDLLTGLYGGLCLYDTALGSDPDTLFAPAEAGIVGAACYKDVNTSTIPCRGSYNAAESDIALEKGYATFVYDFTTNQANGTIASVCLTSVRGSYLCEMPQDMKPTRTQEYCCNLLSKYLAPGVCNYSYTSNSSGAPLYADANKQILVVGRIAATDAEKTLELRYYDASPARVDLFDWRDKTTAAKNPRETKTLPLEGLLPETGYNSSYCRLCADTEAGKLYVVVMPSSTVAKGAVIKVREYDLETLTAKDYTLPNNTGTDLNGYVCDAKLPILNGLVYEGWLYMLRSQTIYRIRLTDPTRVESIAVPSGAGYLDYVTDVHDGRIYMQCGHRGATGMVINTHTATLMYTACLQAAIVSSSSTMNAVIPTVGGGTAPAVDSIYDADHDVVCQARPNYLGTINDLDAPVEKTADKTMKITYTLRKGE